MRGKFKALVVQYKVQIVQYKIHPSAENKNFMVFGPDWLETGLKIQMCAH